MSRIRKAKRAAKKPAVLAGPGTALLSNSPPPPTAGRAFSQCLAAISLLEVACRSLDCQEIEAEQAVLRCASRAVWDAHDYLFSLQKDTDDKNGGGGTP